MEKRGLFAALSTILGTTIGAGIFALPYVFAQSGFLLGLVHLLVLGVVMGIISLYLAEVVLRTKGKHQLTGLAERYLGYYGKLGMNAAMVFSIYGALIAYTFGAGEVLAAMTGLPARLLMLVFFTILAIVIYFNLEVLEDFEEFFTPLKVVVIMLLCVGAFVFIKPENLTGVSLRSFFVPYGVVLFAYTGVSLIPEMSREVRDKKILKRAIIWGIAISGVIYALYSAVVLGVVGSSLKEVSTISLGASLGAWAGVLLNLFTVLALGTAFVALGFALKENYSLDYQKKNLKAWAYVVVPPLVFILFGIGGFVRLIELSAILGIGAILLMIVVMHARARRWGDRRPEFVVPQNTLVKMLMVLLIVFGMVYELGRLLF